MSDLLFKDILRDLQIWIDVYEKEENKKLKPLKIYVLGQLSLLIHTDPRLSKLSLAATRDVDALVKGPYPVQSH